MPDHHGSAIAHQIFRHIFCLAIIASIIATNEFKLLARNAAFGINLVNGRLRTMYHLLAENRILAGHGASNADRDVCVGGGGDYGS